MKRYFLLLFLGILLTLCVVPRCMAFADNRIIAEVNGTPITSLELYRILSPIHNQYEKVYSGQQLKAMIAKARDQALKQLIEHHLILQEAQRLGLSLEKRVVTERVNEIKAKFKSRESFLEYLKAEELTISEFEEKIEDSLMVQALELREVKKKASVSPIDIESYYRENPEKFISKQQYHVLHIMIRKKDDDAKNPREKIDGVKALLSEGKPFEQLAIQFSEGPNKEKGGDMGFVTQGHMIKELDDYLPRLQVNTWSPVIESKIGYHLLFLKAIKKEKSLSLEEAYKKIEETLFRRKYLIARREWLNKLKKRAYISIKRPLK